MTYIIGICGGSGSGKTTLASLLCDELGKEYYACLTLDNYYIDFVKQGRDPAHINYDHPESLEIDLLCQNLTNLRSGKAAQVPQYNFNSHTRKLGTITVESKKFVVVDGLFLYTIPALNIFFDLRVYIDLPEKLRFERRKKRDMLERGRKLDSVLEQYQKYVLPMHKEHVDPNKEFAQLTLNGRENPSTLVHKVLDRMNTT